MFSYKGPVYAVDLASRVNDCGSVDIFHSKGEIMNFILMYKEFFCWGVL